MPLQPSPIKRLSGLGAINSQPTLLASPTGNVLLDVLLGAGVGFLAAPSEQQKTNWALGGAVAAAIAGTAGIIGTAGLGIYNAVK